ncbi:MAG TPA: hypothetical protein VL361_17960 [Candidatus Limnocylindrales bacterium]|jgi:hypothetical protein|nr:hypothetical protein [Candidatus Limnocylindrales bacterium]
MQGDDFEEWLHQQPLRKLPAEWRNDILSAANAATEGGYAPRVVSARRPVSSLKAYLAVLLWPSPKAWVGLAAVWVLLITVNHTAKDSSESIASSGAEATSGMIMAWKEQQRILTELIQPAKTASIQPSRQPAPSPRSERSGAPRVVQSMGPSYV